MTTSSAIFQLAMANATSISRPGTALDWKKICESPYNSVNATWRIPLGSDRRTLPSFSSTRKVYARKLDDPKGAVMWPDEPFWLESGSTGWVGRRTQGECPASHFMG